MSWRRGFNFFNNSDPEHPAKVLITFGIISYAGWRTNPSFMFNHTVNSEVNTIRNKKYYTMFTSAFSEKDGLSLLFNSLTLWFFSPQITSMIGAQGIYTLYFSGSVCHFLGNYYQAKLRQYKSNLPSFTSQRAAVSALLTYYILCNPWSTIYIFIFPVPAILVGLLLLVIGNSESDKNSYLYGSAGSLLVYLLTNFRR